MADDAGCEEAAAIADRVTAWHGRSRTIEPLSGGLTNRNYLVRVEAPSMRAVIRLNGKDTHLLGIDRVTELAAATYAASQGWAPPIIDYVEPPGCLVTEFVDVSSGSHFTDDADLAQIGSILRGVHAGPAHHSTFGCFDIATTYARTASDHGVAIPAVFDRAMAIADEIEHAFAARPEPLVPAHNDLLDANFLRGTDGRIWLIDWEYAGMNSRWFDLGNLAANNGLGRDVRDALLHAYTGSVTAGGAARIELMMVISDLREAMWGVVQQGISSIEFDYIDYAARHFDRLLRNATDAGFQQALQNATMN